MIRISTYLRRVELEAFVQAMCGGVLCLCGGVRPTDPTTPPGPGETIVPIWFEPDALKVVDGVVVAHVAEALATGEGRVTRFVFVTVAREPLLDGDAGVRTGEIRLNRVDLLPGDHVTLDLELRLKD